MSDEFIMTTRLAFGKMPVDGDDDIVNACHTIS